MIKTTYRAPNPYSTGCSIAVKFIYHDIKTFQMNTLYEQKSNESMSPSLIIYENTLNHPGRFRKVKS